MIGRPVLLGISRSEPAPKSVFTSLFCALGNFLSAFKRLILKDITYVVHIK